MNALQGVTHTDASLKHHLLLMEDEPTVAQGLQLALSHEGYAVDVATTGRDAMDLFEQDGFDLVLADLRLPDIDGMDVVEKIKHQRPETEVIIITAYPSVTSAVRSANLGVRDYLRKPFTNQDLKYAVAGALTAHEATSPDRFLDKTQEGKLLQKREVFRVLDRAYADKEFWKELMETGSQALADYHLSGAAKAATASGDLRWINENIGELTQKQLMFIYKRLEREAW